MIRTDNALEFHALKPWCSARGIELEFIEPDTLPQNGVAECFNRIILEIMRALLLDVRVSKKFWKYAVVTANYIRNLTTTVTTDDGEKKSPHEMWHGHPPDLSHLRKWGCRVMYYSKPESKLESRVMDATFVMYGKSTRQYYVIPRGGNSLRLVTSPEFREREKGYLGEWKPEAPASTPLLPESTPVSSNVRVESMGGHPTPHAPMHFEVRGMMDKPAPPLDSQKSNGEAAKPSLVPGKGENILPMERQQPESRAPPLDTTAPLPDEQSVDCESANEDNDNDPHQAGQKPMSDGYGENPDEASPDPAMDEPQPRCSTQI